MKKTSLTILLVASFFQMETWNAQAAIATTFKDKLVAFNQSSAMDPQFQLRKMKIQELTNEESLAYSTEEYINNDFTGIVPGGIPSIPNIPPIPPQAGNLLDGGLTTGTGPGGNTTPPTPQPTGVMSGIIMLVDQLVAIGAKIMPTIEKGRAVVTQNYMHAVSVLPRIDALDPVVHDMGNWSIPVSKHYKISYENGFGSEVVSFIYSITFQHSGTYNDKGHYLAGIRMSARDIRVSWGFDLDATSQLIQISNVGTANNVIAGATVEITYTVKNWTRTLSTSKAFHVTGDGRVFQLD